jgi:hypothetical protein
LNQGIGTVHSIPVGGPHVVSLSHRSYQIYQDPGTSPAPPANFVVVGPTGRLRLQPVSGHVSPFDIATPLLGMGAFIPAVTFEAPVAGTYNVSVNPQGQTAAKVFIAEPRSVAFWHLLPGAMGLVVAACLVIVGLVRLRRKRRPRPEPISHAVHLDS